MQLKGGGSSDERKGQGWEREREGEKWTGSKGVARGTLKSLLKTSPTLNPPFAIQII